MPFNPAMHGLRGLAALMVLLYHWRTNFPAAGNQLARWPFAGEQWNLMFLIDFGWVGVHWFFVLSGYLLAGVLWAQPLHARTVVDFWQRRFTRIYPAHWFQMLVMSCLTAYTLLLSQLDPVRFVHNILLWLAPLPGGSAAYNGVWWTLPIELGFYLVLPLLIALYRKTGVVPLLVTAFVISIGWRFLVVSWRVSPDDPVNMNLIRQLPGTLSLFVVGVALNHLQGWRPPRLWVVSVAAASLCYGAWLYVIGLHKGPPRADDWTLYLWEPALGVIVALLVWLLTQPTRTVHWLCSRPLVWLGTLSYGIYLWHFPVLRLLPRLVPGPWKTIEGSWLALLICLAVTLPLALLSYHAVEKPALNGMARWQSRRKRPALA